MFANGESPEYTPCTSQSHADQLKDIPRDKPPLPSTPGFAAEAELT